MTTNTGKFSLAKLVGVIALIMLVAVIADGVPFSPWTHSAQGGEEDTAKRDADGEVAGASKEAKDKLDGFTDGIGSFFNGISESVMNTFSDLSKSINQIFGADEDAGMGAFFGTVVWAVLIITFLFVAKFAYNIVKSIFGGGESSVPDRYRKG